MSFKIQHVFKIFLISLVVLAFVIIMGAFWDTAYTSWKESSASSSSFPLETSATLQSVIESKLTQSEALEQPINPPNTKPMQQNTLTWTMYEYTVRLKASNLFSEFVYALSETIYGNGGEIFQTYFQSAHQKATMVVGIGTFITHHIVLTWEDIESETETPTARQQEESAGQLKAAIIIDDLGTNEHVVYQLLEFQADFTFSILPHLEKSTDVAALLHEHQRETLLHLPMEPKDFPAQFPGKGAIMSTMTPDQIQATIQQDLQTVPYVTGVNNHMGSRLTADHEQMRIVLETLQQHGLFFLDSRTTSNSVAYTLAQELGMPTAERKVFLDVIPQYDFVQKQLYALIALAEQGEPAIAIGHPKEPTLRALRAMLPEFKRRNIRIVRLSELTHPPFSSEYRLSQSTP